MQLHAHSSQFRFVFIRLYVRACVVGGLQTNEQTNEQTYEQTNEQTNERTNELGAGRNNKNASDPPDRKKQRKRRF
jgi:hypothetical protein